jgi:16S rRNA (guanine(966)-N(2))-methyltransferase RsmD
MRIIAGEYRGRILKSPHNNKTRPTSDRLRETLFNILNHRIDSSTKFLDLCAGTGAIGIESISRGCGFATFVDISRKVCGLIEENLDLLEIPEERTEIFCLPAVKFLKKQEDQSWKIIYFDPPYNEDYYSVLNEIGTENPLLLDNEGVLIAEHHSKNILPDLIGQIRRWRIIKQGETWLSFYEKN